MRIGSNVEKKDITKYPNEDEDRVRQPAAFNKFNYALHTTEEWDRMTG
jgi:hypothetical protein